MIQKTLITNNSEELKDFLENLRQDDAYYKSGDKILLFSDQDNDVEHLRNQSDLIRRILPDVKIVGISMPKSGIVQEYGTSFTGAGFSFLLMDHAKVDLYYYDCQQISALDAGKKFRREIRYKDHIAGIMLFSAGVEKEIDKFLTAVAMGDKYDIPILGAQAGATGRPYICGSFNGGAPCFTGIVALVFHGRGLSMYYNYDMGWKPIGKEMKVTKTDGNYSISSIDDRPAVSIYQEYLGVEPDEYFIENVREFPFITTRGERQVVRTPSGYDENGNLHFIARINEGDTLKLSYGNPRRLLDETKLYADLMRSYGPQALFLVVCENRASFLKEQAATDITGYKNFMPQMGWVRGLTAIMMDKQGGGVVNSAILSVGMREGAPRVSELARPTEITPRITQKGAIPLDQRLAMFLEKTTKELEDMAIAADGANAAKSEFLSQMSHEIRTPINAVLGMNEMILRESKNERILKYAQNVQTAGLSLLGIISDILDFSKIEAGKMDIFPYEYELASLVNDLVNLIRLRAEGKGLALSVDVNPDTPHLLFGDEIRVKQIITNLLTNAVKYTEKGSVHFSIDYRKTSEDTIILDVSVKDTGIGIKKENIHKLFHAFDRIDLNRARKIEGTGLGINITQQLLTLMGSTLQVTSTYGEGSNFYFSLEQKVTNWDPVGDYTETQKSVNAKRSEKKSRFTAETARILVVDDAPMNLDVISGLLRRTKIQVDTADSGAMCIEKFGKNTYDLVFLDHRMPNMDGIETLLRMKEIYGDDLKGIPIISLTANAVAGARDEYIAAGFIDYLTKPVMSDELEMMLEKHLPAEKVQHLTEDEIPEQPAVLPEWLSGVHMLDTKKGVEFCGGIQEYLDALRIFRVSIAERANEIEILYQNGDIENYTIKVHALKSMTRTIGAAELSELAASLEAAGNAGDKASIDAGTGVLLTLYRQLEGALEPLKITITEDKKKSGNQSHHILLVDDDEDFLALLSRWLKKDYKVDTVSSGEDAIAYLQNESPELVLLDYAMPGMSGIEVLTRIREDPETTNLPVIFLTGTDDRETVKDAEKLNPAGFLLKSIGKSGLLIGIANFFE